MIQYNDNDVRIVGEPFRHFVSSDWFHSSDLDAVIGWLEAAAPWKRRGGDFYDQYGLDLTSACSPKCKRLVDEDTLESLRNRMSAIFGVQLSDRVTVVAHKLEAGQGIGIHTDNPLNDQESYRLVLTLDRDFTPEKGGYLVLCSGPSEESIERIYEPRFGRIVGLELSPFSYHAVTDVLRGCRLSIVYSFWLNTIGDAKNYDHVVVGDGGKNLLDLLRAIGVGGVKHSGATLLDHLVGTFLVLRRWGCPEDLQLAGLSHSIYGTEGFSFVPMEAVSRDRLRSIVGANAEDLVFCFSKDNRREILASWLEGREDSELNGCKAIDIAILELANTIEQAGRLSRADLGACEFERKLFLAVQDNLSEVGRKDLEGFFGNIGSDY
jgi:hypothetical protein